MSTPKIGDVVVLNSGSAPFTVTEVFEETIIVVWFSDDDELCSTSLPIACVEILGKDDHEKVFGYAG